MAISCKKQGDKIIVMGNTYPHKEQIKAFGARFNGQLKVWEIKFTDESWSKVGELCVSTGGGVIESSPPPFDPDPPESVSAQIKDKISTVPKEVKKRSGEIPKSLDIKGADFALPKKLEGAGKDGLSVTELMNVTAQKITDAFPVPVWVIGEIQNINFRGQSVYLSLADGIQGANAAATITVNATIWQSTFQTLAAKHTDKTIREILQDGVKLRILAQVSLYKGRGQLSLNVKDIDPGFTKGELALKREELIKELKQKGLYEANRKCSLSEFPFKVGLISAKGSRAESDFIHQLTGEGFCGEVIFRPTPMQGDKVPKEVKKAISELEKRECDIIVLTRGGGSAADLRWFDAKEVALAIANSKTPIISAIGHHDDMTIAEDISFYKAKTPTAAAQLIVDLFLETKERIENLANLLATNLERSLALYSERQNGLSERLEMAAQRKLARELEALNHLFYKLDIHLNNTVGNFSNLLNSYMHELSAASLSKINEEQRFLLTLSGKIERGSVAFLNEQELKVMELNSQLSSLNPGPWINKGWTQLYSEGNKITSIKQIKKGSKIDLRLKDGLVKADVTETEKR